MLLQKLSPWSLFFSLILSLSVIWGSLSPHGLTLWLIIEINMYSFVPLILARTSGINRKEAAMKYLLIQAIGSVVFLLSLIDLQVNFLPSTFSFMILITASLLKIGAAPLHHWFPSVLRSLSWPICSLLLTIQKILPLILISWALQPINSTSSIIFLFAIIGALVGGWGGINQSILRPLLAYSRIGHISWIITSAAISKSLIWLYVSIYILNIIPLILILSITIKSPSSELKSLLYLSSNQRIIITFLFFSLGGLPPLLGFFPKLLLFSIITSKSLLLMICLIIGSLINLYYYFKFRFIILLNKSTLPLSKPKTLLTPILPIIILSFFICSWLFLYAMTLLNKP